MFFRSPSRATGFSLSSVWFEDLGLQAGDEKPFVNGEAGFR
jgi:hypothetical protein